MNTKITLLLALIWCGWSLGCSTTPQDIAAGLDLTAHRIEQANEHSKPYQGGVWTEWQNVLVFSNSNISTPLARSGIVRFGSDFHEDHGFDPASLKLQWLKEGELLWISWTTFYLGSGGYTHDGHVVLQIRSGQARELFRNHFESVAKGGWGAQYFSSLKITYDDRDRTFTFSRRNTEINGDMGTPKIPNPYPFTTAFTNDDGQIGFGSKVHTLKTWQYKLAGNRLKFMRGTEAIDLGHEMQPIEEIVEGFHINRAALEAMNPALRGQREATGIVLIRRELKPYETSSDDGLRGDKPE